MVQNDTAVDRWGIDPLKVEMFDQVDNSDSTLTTIDASMEGNPQLVSYKNYGSQSMWPHILVANALVHPSEFVAGMKVKLPVKRIQPIAKIAKKVVL